MPRRRPVLRALADELARTHPELEDPRAAITAGHVTVDGIVRLNPSSLVRAGAAIALRSERRLRGELKLTAALAAFGVSVARRVALDVGAAAGGFTRVLLKEGAAASTPSIRATGSFSVRSGSIHASSTSNARMSARSTAPSFRM